MAKIPKHTLLSLMAMAVVIGVLSGLLVQILPAAIVSMQPLPLPKSQGTMILLNTRRFNLEWEAKKSDTEKDSPYVYAHRELDLNRTALILIDVWETDPNDGSSQRGTIHRQTKIVPLLALARKHNMIIMHAPNGRAIAEDSKPLPGEIVIASQGVLGDTLQLDLFLKTHNITTLLYAGYASNLCVLTRPTGIIKMSERGYNIVLIRDATLAFETPESSEGEWANVMAITMVEQLWGESTTIDDLRSALEGD